MAAALRHVTKISSLSPKEIAGVLRLAIEMKARPRDYWDALKRKTLLMLFEKPSLRTRVSLEAGMTSLGGHGIAYMTGDSPIGEKETYEDTGAVLSRMADAVTARVKSRDQIEGLAAWSTIPIINALDDLAHPMQMLADLQTIAEHKRGGDVDSLKGVSLAFSGDCQNNVTYDLMRAGALCGLATQLFHNAALTAGRLAEQRRSHGTFEAMARCFAEHGLKAAVLGAQYRVGVIALWTGILGVAEPFRR
mmetsp:Transcript_4604/g.14694  ORF Transcript_4604/g.14694 Transcript_4604/m.14694 type:complete len:249 (-) Transcript_4604:35-781(-)